MPTVNRVQRPWLKPQPKSKAPNGPIPENFYRLAKWRKLRARVLEQHPLCAHCKEQKQITVAQMVDHTTPIRLGGEPYDEANLLPLCNKCHNVKRGKERHQ